MTRRIPIVALALALAALAVPASAQTVAFRAPVRLAAPPGLSPYFYSLARYSTAEGPDLFAGTLGSAPAQGAFWPRGTQLAQAPFPYPASTLLVATYSFAAGDWGNGDALADLAWSTQLGLYYDRSPNGGWTKGPDFGIEPTGLLFAHLLDRTGDVLVLGNAYLLEAWYLYSSTPADPSSYTPLKGTDLGYPTPPLPGPPTSVTSAVQRVKLGPFALGVAPGSAGKGLDDVVWSRTQNPSLSVVWTSTVRADFNLPNISEFYPGVDVVFPGALEVHGAGALDVDGDGIPDLVAAVASAVGPGSLVAVRNDGVLADLPSGTRTDLTATLGLVDPQYAAAVDLGYPAVAIWDRNPLRPLIAVATRDPALGPVAWSGPAIPGGNVRQVMAGDVTGSAAPDLVVGYADGAIDVFPGSLPPAIDWSAALPPPAHASRAAGFQVGVEAAADPDGSIARVDLFADGALAGSATSPPYVFALPPALLAAAGCTLSLVAIATDDLGIAREVAASGVLDLDPPAVTLADGGGPVPVRLAPGGTSFSVAATALDPCAASIDFQWSATGLPPGASAIPAGAGASSRLDVLVLEADYPALVARLDRTAAFTVTASNGTSSSAAWREVVDFDASGLVAVSQVADRTALAPGELALLTTTLSSAIGVDLPEVRLDTALLGLEPAGPPRVEGAVLLSQGAFAGGPSLTLDRIPGGGAPVTVELVVRRGLSGGGASGAQVRSAVSGAALSPALDATPPRATPPGLSCGQPAGSPLVLLAAWLYVKAMRRVLARTRSTSSSTPMRRQA